MCVMEYFPFCMYMYFHRPALCLTGWQNPSIMILIMEQLHGTEFVRRQWLLSWSRNSWLVMELEVHQISPYRPSHNISLGTTVLFPFYRCLGLQSGLFPSSFLTIYFVCLLQMCPAYQIFL